MNRRNTWQKEAVKSRLMEACHPTADELYESLKIQYPGIGLTTVYRNLGILEEAGEISRVIGISGLGESERYDGNVDPHDHFVCLKCGKVCDIERKERADEQKTIEADHGFKVVGCRVSYYGYCGDCEELAEN